MRVQHVLVWGGVGPKNKDHVVTSLVTLLDEFPSDSFRVDVSGKLFSKIGDKCVWEIVWSSIIDVNWISGPKNGDIHASSHGDWGSWFVGKAKPGKGESKSVDEVEEIFAVLL